MVAEKLVMNNSGCVCLSRVISKHISADLRWTWTMLLNAIVHCWQVDVVRHFIIVWHNYLHNKYVTITQRVFALHISLSKLLMMVKLEISVPLAYTCGYSLRKTDE